MTGMIDASSGLSVGSVGWFTHPALAECRSAWSAYQKK